MSSDSFIHVCFDSAEKQAAEQVLTELGLNMAATIRRKQIAREKSVLAPEANSYHDVLAAHAARASGYLGQDADEVIEEMNQILRMSEI